MRKSDFSIAQYIYELDPEEKYQLEGVIKDVHLEKGGRPVVDTRLHKTVIYVVRGVMCKVAHKGDADKTIDLYFSDQLISFPTMDYEHLFPVSLRCVSKAHLYVFELEKFNNLKHGSQGLSRLENMVLEQLWAQTQIRLETFQLLNATERYEWLLDNHGAMVNEVPLKYIADYLGINQASLSKIRAGLK